MGYTLDQPLQGVRVLIAEDEAILAIDMENSLRNAGAEVEGPAGTLADTLTLARSASLTCAVLDVNLHSELVFPAAQVLKERGIGILFHTGYGDLEGLRRDWPDAQVLTKPVPGALLIRATVACCGIGAEAAKGRRYCL